MCASQRLQLTVSLIKPDIIAQPHNTQKILDLMLKSGFMFVRSRRHHLHRAEAEHVYAEHYGRFFHNRLVTYMSSGPIGAYILARYDAIAVWRQIMGPTKVFRAIYEEPDCIRARFGLTDTRNATHGSDSEESARKEMKFFFPTFSPDDWYGTDEALFRSGHVNFDSEKCVHVITR